MDKVYVYSDGGARGNPGPAAIGIVLLDENKKIIKTFSSYLGLSTNNRAEYNGVIKGLELALKHTKGEVVFTLDSELVVKQLKGDYAVKDKYLRLLYEKVLRLVSQFNKVSFNHVNRTNNYIVIADKLVNDELDKQKIVK